MESGNLLFGMVCLLVAVVSGFMVGRWTAPDVDETVEEGAADLDGGGSTGRGMTSSARPGADGDRSEPSRLTRGELQQHVAFLEGELSLQQLRKQTLEYELYGEPIPWPEQVPEDFQPEAFQANVRGAVEECAPDVEVVGFDCSEPPCLVHLRGGDEGWWNRLINECPGWVDRYGSTVSSSSGSLDCPGGTTERYRIVGPYREQPWSEGPDAEANQGKRFGQRVEQAKFEWECTGS